MPVTEPRRTGSPGGQAVPRGRDGPRQGGLARAVRRRRRRRGSDRAVALRPRRARATAARRPSRSSSTWRSRRASWSSTSTQTYQCGNEEANVGHIVIVASGYRVVAEGVFTYRVERRGQDRRAACVLGAGQGDGERDSGLGGRRCVGERARPRTTRRRRSRVCARSLANARTSDGSPAFPRSRTRRIGETHNPRRRLHQTRLHPPRLRQPGLTPRAGSATTGRPTSTNSPWPADPTTASPKTAGPSRSATASPNGYLPPSSNRSGSARRSRR